jgi:hypothetical protein
MRLLAVVGGCIVVPVACLVTAAEYQGPVQTILAGTAFGAPIVSLLLFVSSYRFARARPERALELARLAGIEPATVGRFFAEHLTPDEEDRLRNLIAEQVDFPHSP